MICAEPVNGKAATLGAYEALVACEAVTAKLVISLPVPSVRIFLELPEIYTKSS